jgi:hypothetical protein
MSRDEPVLVSSLGYINKLLVCKENNGPRGSISSNFPFSSPIPSFVWKKNSCWLDSSLEALYHTVKWFPRPSRADSIGDISKMNCGSIQARIMELVSSRVQMEAESSPHLSIQSNLSLMREGIRNEILESKLGTILSNGFANPIVSSLIPWRRTLKLFQNWVEDIVLQDMGKKGAGYLTSLLSYSQIQISRCELATPHTKKEVREKIAVFHHKNPMNPVKNPKITFRDLQYKIKATWEEEKQEPKDSCGICGGYVFTTKQIIRPPLVIIFNNLSELHKWKPQEILHIRGPHTHRQLIYKFIAFISYSQSENHYRTTFVLGSSLYIYDGYNQDGYACRSNSQDLCEAWDKETDWSPSFAFYRLLGGENASKVHTACEPCNHD